ncbi:MAG: MAPEG family protein [Halioglobus sp.]|nr:MAPEG family protein [Halioglobus sp.]
MNVLLPSFLLFALTMFVQFRLGILRFAAVKSGEVDPELYRSYEGYPEPERLRVHSRHLVNLYEAPLLFYVITIIAFITGNAGTMPVVLAWMYVILRCLHSYVHLTSNRVMLRFRLFLASLAVLIALWVVVLAAMLLN